MAQLIAVIQASLRCFGRYNFVTEANIISKPRHKKTCFMLYANIKDAGPPALPCSLISVFIVRCLDTIIPILAMSKISRLQLATEEQAGLSHT